MIFRKLMLEMLSAMIKKRMNINKRKKKAANRIYNILPDDQAKEYIILWNEFKNTLTK